MTCSILWMPAATADLEKLPMITARRIITKMDWYIRQEDPLRFAKRLTDALVGTYRFRVGDYRVLCDVRQGEITVLEVLRVRHRKNAYRR